MLNLSIVFFAYDVDGKQTSVDDCGFIIMDDLLRV